MNPITYPARPINGGPLDKVLPKSGAWCYEPKYNGWRALLHVPTGTLFNRKGQRLSIEQEFSTAIASIQELTGHGRDREFSWLDCEALERRLPIGKGSLLILDAPLLAQQYITRRRILHNAFGILNIYAARDGSLADNSVHSVPWFDGESGLGPDVLWQRLQEENTRLRCQFYEGLVAKRADSRYPIQLRSPSEEFPFWVKHRWQF